MNVNKKVTLSYTILGIRYIKLKLNTSLRYAIVMGKY